MILPKRKLWMIKTIKDIDWIISELDKFPNIEWHNIDLILQNLHVIRLRLKNKYRLTTKDIREWELKQ